MRTPGKLSSIFLCLLIVAVLTISGSSLSVQAAAGGEGRAGNVTMFTLDINSGGGAGPASNWYSINGGEQIIHPVDRTSGDDTRYIEFEEINVIGPIVPSAGGTRKELLDWLNGWATGSKRDRVQGTLDMLDSDGEPARTFEFKDVIPTSYQPSSVTSGNYELLEETLTFKPMYIEYPSNPGRGISYSQDVEGEILTGGFFLFQIDGRYVPLFSCTPGGMGLIPEEAVGGDEPWDNKPGLGRGVNWVGGDEPWDNKPGRGGGSDWVGGDEPWDNKPGQGSGSDWMIGDDPWDNKPGNGAGSDWVGGDEPWDNKPGMGNGVNWMIGDDPWDNKPGRGGGADWVGGDEPWDNKFNYMYFSVSEVKFGTWTIQKEFDRTDMTLQNLYDDFASGRRMPNPSDSGELTYLDSAGNEARAIDFFGYAPTSYDIINVDSGSGGTVLMEIMEFEVMYCTYT